MIDLHCHLLADVDDGPATIAEAADLATQMYALGIKTAVATPHLSHRYPTTAAASDEAAQALRTELSSRGCELTLLTGAEIAFDQIRDATTEELHKRTLGSGNCLLVESPFQNGPEDAELLIHDLQVQGFRVLLAHPERSWFFHSNTELLSRLVERGALCSITASSFTGAFGRPVSDEAFRLAKAGLAHNVSSDAHNLDRRPPGLDVGSQQIEGLPTQEARDELARELLGT